MRMDFLAAALAVAGLLAPAFTGDGVGGAATPPPNILLVIADDFGIDTSPCYDTGTEKPTMPTLERLCRTGLVFDRFWAAPECSPTRAAILTGRYGFRTGVGAALQRSEAGLSTDELSLQTLLAQQVGTRYASAVIGKWHLATDANGWADHPARMGVPFYTGLLSGVAESYSRWQRTDNGVTALSTTYITTQITNDAIGWLGRQQAPWFLWLAYTAPHAPIHLPPSNLHSRRDLPGTAADIESRPLPYHFAMAEALDHELGRLLESLDAATRARTVVIFIGDNGTASAVTQPASDRARAKGTLYEGGVHTPLIVSGPAVARAGQREGALVGAVDLFPTIAQLAGEAREVWQDGRSFAALLSDAGAPTRSDLYTEYFDSTRTAAAGWAIRDQRYKLIVFTSGARRLYDLAQDPTEQRDLSTSSDASAVDAFGRLLRRGEEIRSTR